MIRCMMLDGSVYAVSAPLRDAVNLFECVLSLLGQTLFENRSE